MSQHIEMSDWWHDMALEDQWQIVGNFDHKHPHAFEEAWLEFVEKVLEPSGYPVPDNAWKLDADRQQVFVDFLVNTCQEFNRFLECAYADAMEPGWDAGSSE